MRCALFSTLSQVLLGPFVGWPKSKLFLNSAGCQSVRESTLEVKDLTGVSGTLRRPCRERGAGEGGEVAEGGRNSSGHVFPAL